MEVPVWDLHRIYPQRLQQVFNCGIPSCPGKSQYICLFYYVVLIITHHTQEQLLAELMANPVPPPPPLAVSLDATAVASAVPPHKINGVEITIQDLMVTESKGAMKDKDLSEWLDEREKLGFQKMAETKATGRADIDESTVRTLAQKYRQDNDKVKCRGNAITRSCAFTGSFVILECGRRVLYPECPGEVYMLMR